MHEEVEYLFSETEGNWWKMVENNAVLHTTADFLYKLYLNFFVWTLFYFYRNLPRMGGFGGWAGMETSEICCELLKIEAKFWDIPANKARCQLEILRRFYSLYTFFMFVAYIFLLWVFFHKLTGTMLSLFRFVCTLSAFFYHEFRMRYQDNKKKVVASVTDASSPFFSPHKMYIEELRKMI